MRAQAIVGRTAERAAVTAVLELARAGEGGCVVVAGPAGVGKSTLVDGAVGDAVDVVVGRAVPAPSVPLRPLCEIASLLVGRGAQADDPRLRMHRSALAHLLPGVPPTGAGGSEPPTPLHVADAVLALRAASGRRAPSVLAVEDLHWADEATWAAVEYLADRTRAGPPGLVVTLRPEGPAWGLARRLAGRRSATLIELAPFGSEDTRAFVVSCLGADPPPGLLAAVAPAGGVPLLVEELLSAYEQRADLVRVGDRWHFDPTAPVLPASVTESVERRLGALSLQHRPVVEAAALLGQEFEAGLLRVALDVPAADVDAALRAALAAGLLAPERRATRLHFAHALVRDAVLAATTGVREHDLATRLLSALGPRLDEGRDVELGAALAAAAGQAARAAELLEGAGRDLLARAMPAAAVERFDRALAAAPAGAASLTCREALLQALALAGNVDRAEREGEVVQRLLAATGAGERRRQRCAAAVARAAANAGRWADAGRLLASAPGAGGSATTSATTATTTAALAALVALELGRFDEAEAAALWALQDPAVEPASVCEASEVMGRLARRRSLDEARGWFEKAATTAELHDLALWKARALHELATIDQLQTLAVDGLLRARQAAIDAGAPGLLAAVDFHVAALHGVRFEPGLALAAARRCLDTARDLGARRQEAWAWNLIGQAYAAGNERVRARAAAAEALALAPDDPEIGGVAIGTARGLASLLAEDRDRATAEWREAIASLRLLPDVAPLPPWYLWPLLATVYNLERDGGERARAETDGAALRLASGPDGLWLLAAAVAQGRAGDVDGARCSAAEAEVRFARSPAFAGYIHLGYRYAAEAAIADGWGDPVAWLGAGARWFGDRQFEEAAKACRSLARRAGVRPRRTRAGASVVPPELDRLGVTGRELDVLRLVAQGLTNREIAERLYIGPRTVKGHVESLLTKTGTANRTQLSALSPPGP